MSYGMFSSSILGLCTMCQEQPPHPLTHTSGVNQKYLRQLPFPFPMGPGCLGSHTSSIAAWLWALGPILYFSTFQIPHCSMGIKVPPSQGYFEDYMNQFKGKFLAQSLAQGNTLFPRKPPALITYITIVTSFLLRDTPSPQSIRETWKR